MRRDTLQVAIETPPDGPPVLAIEYEGAASDVAEMLSGPTGTGLEDHDLDVAFRRTADDDPGVLSLSNRLTGAFVLEANVDWADIERLVEAVRDGPADEERYRIRLSDGSGRRVFYEKETLLVYGEDGSLLRHRSIIPSGVEL